MYIYIWIYIYIYIYIYVYISDGAILVTADVVGLYLNI